MNKVRSMTVGIPLRNTSPAAIEDFLVDKVRNDLGDLKDAALIRPMLKIDSEDGDLSGNVTDGFGTVLITVNGHTLHLPFIISKKELLPFDSIRMGSDEVSYDMSKLRRLVIALEKQKEEPEAGGDVMEVVDIRDVPTHNGFLGTIMAVRNNQKHRDASGLNAFEGDSFGDVNLDRVMKTASAEVEVAEVFEDFHEKLADVRFFSEDDVKATVDTIAKKAETETQKMIDSLTSVSVQTKETEDAKREVARLDATRLVEAQRAASGNNVRFPVYEDNRFEFRHGRVYHNFKPFGTNGLGSDIKKIIIDSKGEYAMLSGSEKFMLDANPPEVEFAMPVESGRGIAEGMMYTVEENDSTVRVPFVVEKGFRSSYKDNGILVSVRERMELEKTREFPVDPTANSLFYDAFICSPVFGKGFGQFTLLVLKNSDAPLTEMTDEKIKDFIAENSEHGSDASNARFLARHLSSFQYFTIGEHADLFKMTRKIAGHFTRPDGLFKEGPLFQKEAAYDQSNKARLYINEQKRPATYSVEWSFAKDADVDGNQAYNRETKKMENLAPAQAKKILEDLGFDARKQELFFQIAKRNGRYAEFRLPDVTKAESITPKDVGLAKAKEAMANIANATMNAKNFVPVMQDFAADGIAGAAAAAREAFAKQAEESYKTAVEFEKIAERIRGKEWTEVTCLLNMKHHLDKVACQISEGFVKNAEPVFEKVAELNEEIEKKASLLIDFNRQQLIGHAHPLISPSLVKEALHQFDGLSAYTGVKESMEKQARFFRGGAPLFHRGARNQIASAEQQVAELVGQQNAVADKLRSEIIYLRTLEQKGQKDSPKYKEVMGRAKGLQEEKDAIASELASLKGSQAEIDEGIRNKNRLAGAVIGLPGIAAASYGYEGFKDS